MDENLGNILRKARESTGKTVDDAVYLAKIPRAVVEALESENFGFFTSTLYARSFLKQYGDYVGADVEQWLDDLEPTTMIDGEAVESFIDLSEPVAAAVTKEQPKTRGAASNSAWAALWMLLITGGLVWGGIKVYENFESKLAGTDPVAHSVEPEKTLPVESPADQEIEPKPQQEEKTTVAEAVAEPPRRAIIVTEEP